VSSSAEVWLIAPRSPAGTGISADFSEAINHCIGRGAGFGATALPLATIIGSQ
jgi:hypothetical protein